MIDPVVITSYARTPMGAFQGAFSNRRWINGGPIVIRDATVDIACDLPIEDGFIRIEYYMFLRAERTDREKQPRDGQ